MDKKEKIQAIPQNLKINTRIVMTSVFAIVIPMVLIAVLAIIFLSVSSSKISSPSFSSSSYYSTFMQMQWNQMASNLVDELNKDEPEGTKLQDVKKICEGIEGYGAFVYISKNGNEYYSTDGKSDILQIANEICIDKSSNSSYYFSEKGLVIFADVSNDNADYSFVIVNENMSFSGFNLNQKSSIIGNYVSTTAMVIVVIVLIFIIAIVVISLITSKTIIVPINQITEGANEIAKGNFEHEIEYKSKNELGTLADSFNYMRLRVKEAMEEQSLADKKQKEMIAGIAHDLRTPLTSVKGYLEGLRDGIADTPEKQEKYMNIIYSSTCDTEKMLDELLAISKLELGSVTLNCEKVSASDFILYAEDLREELEKNDFDLEIKDNTKNTVYLNLDTDSFSRVINNIISNSVKYRNKDIRGKIEITIHEYKSTVLIEIKDNGIGVDRESLPRIFDTLYRADKARSDVRNGSGLGLAICRQIVEMHNGLIWAQSELGKGLSIFISLPIYRED